MEFGPTFRKFLTAILAATPPLLVAKTTDLWAWALLVVTSLGSAMGVQAYADASKTRKATKSKQFPPDP